MTFDTSRIDARIQKLQQLKQLLADPEMAGLMRDALVSTNGTEASAQARSSKGPRRFPRAPGSRKGDLIKTVLAVARDFETQTYTKNSVLKALVDRGFQFATRKPQVAVGGALRKLARQRKIKVTAEGEGRIPNVYSN